MIKLGQHSLVYNCHSYAWYSRTTSNPYWIEDYEEDLDISQQIRLFIHDPHTISVSEKNLQAGDIVVYFSNKEGREGTILHSAVVTSVDSNGVIRCTSKWGKLGLYSHEIYEVPPTYSDDEESGTGFICTYYRYTQGLHDYVESSTYVVSHNGETHTIECRDCDATTAQVHKYKYINVNQSNHRCLCTVCNYSKMQAHEAHPVTGKCKYCLRPGPFAVVTSTLALNQLKKESLPIAVVD